MARAHAIDGSIDSLENELARDLVSDDPLSLESALVFVGIHRFLLRSDLCSMRILLYRTFWKGQQRLFDGKQNQSRAKCLQAAKDALGLRTKFVEHQNVLERELSGREEALAGPRFNPGVWRHVSLWRWLNNVATLGLAVLEEERGCGSSNQHPDHSYAIQELSEAISSASFSPGEHALLMRLRQKLSLRELSSDADSNRLSSTDVSADASQVLNITYDPFSELDDEYSFFSAQLPWPLQ